MSCTNTDAPVNMKATNQYCDVECSYDFKYNPNSSCTVTNRGNYLEITTDGPDTASFNMGPMAVRSVRLYQPSLHTFDGSRAAAELIIQHSTNSGENVLVCRPIKASEAAGASKNFFTQFVEHSPATDGAAATVNVVNWSLNDVLPYGAPFYYYSGPFPYPPCTGGGGGNHIIVYGAQTAGNMSSSDMETLQRLISASAGLAVIASPTITLMYNKAGAGNPAGASGDLYDIYMDCDPITGVGAEAKVAGSSGAAVKGGLGKVNAKLNLTQSFEKYAKSPVGVFTWIILGLLLIYLFVKYMLPVLATKLKQALPASGEGVK